MSLSELDVIANDFGGPPIPEQDTAEPRYPIALLIDVSSSTAFTPPDGSEPDIVKLNAALNLLYQKLKYPQPGDPLAISHHQVDIAVVTYADKANLAQKWTPAPDLPASAPLLSAAGGTSTGMALISALDLVLARLQRYKQQNLPKSGIPHIMHLTDGGVNDVEVGGANWVAIHDRLGKLSADPEKRRGVVFHFVSPNGYKPTLGAPLDPTGIPMTGASVLAKWFGPDSVIPLAAGADNFSKLVQLLVKTITAVSQQAADNQTLLQQLGGRRLDNESGY